MVPPASVSSSRYSEDLSVYPKLSNIVTAVLDLDIGSGCVLVGVGDRAHAEKVIVAKNPRVGVHVERVVSFATRADLFGLDDRITRSGSCDMANFEIEFALARRTSPGYGRGLAGYQLVYNGPKFVRMSDGGKKEYGDGEKEGLELHWCLCLSLGGVGK